MSIVIYDPATERIHADSIMVDGRHRSMAQKIFTYTAIFKKRNGEETEERGLAGFVGDPAIGYALIDAYTDGGYEGCEQRRKELLATMNEEDANSGDILIIPEHTAYMWISSGLSRPFFPVPKQLMAIGHAQITSRVYMRVDDGESIDTALSETITHNQERDADGLVDHPIMTLSMGGTKDHCRFQLQDVVR